ncbi:hypothetical protein PMIN01_03665 [Paraphaeosphaeria minitans]|uniref:Uncharacterized protein n=1 Tax=Paraphaeosphaeria minitans TaxID=565426 RepID=A0A9P6KTJ4_9PLEO|nr:hypothetical protein PMIN01_03665 [Paraphaeosphaeria minitans]
MRDTNRGVVALPGANPRAAILVPCTHETSIAPRKDAQSLQAQHCDYAQGTARRLHFADLGGRSALWSERFYSPSCGCGGCRQRRMRQLRHAGLGRTTGRKCRSNWCC